MTAKKRDQPHHDLVPQYLPGLILNKILGITHKFGDPYDAKPCLGGMVAYPTMTMTAASRNKVSALFQYAGSLFATMMVVKSMTGLPYGHLQGMLIETPVDWDAPCYTTTYRRFQSLEVKRNGNVQKGCTRCFAAR